MMYKIKLIILKNGGGSVIFPKFFLLPALKDH